MAPLLDPLCPGCAKRQGAREVQRHGGSNSGRIVPGRGWVERIERCGRCGWERDGAVDG